MSARPPRDPAPPGSAGPDAAELERLQREAWNDAAPAWHRWFDTFERFAHPVSEALLDLSEVRAGTRVLDVGCGTGEPALTAARRVGPRGFLLGLDPAATMVEIATRRAREAGVPWAQFRAQRVEDLRDAAPFDAAVSRFALMLAPEPAAIAAAVRARLVPGGRFAVAVWGEASEVPMCALVPAVAQRELGVPPPPPDAPGPTRLGAAGALADVLRAGGFEEVEERTLRVEPEFASPAEAARFYEDVSSALRRALAERGAAVRGRVLAAIEAEMARHVDARGRVRLPSTVRIAVGRR